MARCVEKVNSVNVAKEKYGSCNVGRAIVAIVRCKIILSSGIAILFSCNITIFFQRRIESERIERRFGTYEVVPGRRRSLFWQHIRRSPRNEKYRAREVEVDRPAFRTYPSTSKSAEFLAELCPSCSELVSSRACSKFVP